MVLAMFFVASPAQAAAGVDLFASETTIELGDSFNISWTSTDAITLVASGAWSGSKSVPAGGDTVTPPGVGTFTYTLTAIDAQNVTAADSVTVTVTAPGSITPNAVTFPDPCTVVIPTTANVTYFVDYGDGDTEELEADTYDGGYFSYGDPVTFFAEANDGFTLADNAVAEWDYTAPESCSDIDEGPELVSTTIKCGSVTFTNTTDGSLDVEVYGFDDNVDFEPVDAFTLAGGASHTVETDFADIVFGAFEASDEDFPTQIRYLEVPQDCDGGSGNGNGNGDGSDHPTTAPAAGIAAR